MEQGETMTLSTHFFVLTKFISYSLIVPVWIEYSTRPISSRASDVKAIIIISLKCDWLGVDRIIRARLITWRHKRTWGYLSTRRFIQSVRNYNFFRYHSEYNNERNNAHITQNQSILPIKRVRKKHQCGGNRNTGCKRCFSCCNHVLIKLINLVSCYANRSAQFFTDLFRVLIFFVLKIPPIQEQARSNEGKEPQRRTVSRFKGDECGQKSNKKRYKNTFASVKSRFLRNGSISIQYRSIIFYISGICHFLILPFHSYFLTENKFLHSSKINKTQENCACGIFNNSNMKEILS